MPIAKLRLAVLVSLVSGCVGQTAPLRTDPKAETSATSTPGASATSGAAATSVRCKKSTALPANAPRLQVGTWVDITPRGIPKGNPEHLIGQGLALDPCDSAVIYWGVTPFSEQHGGLYRSHDAGASWQRVGDRSAERHDRLQTRFVDSPLRIRIDPNDPRRLYAGSGVRGDTMGFWISEDRGETWTKPKALLEIAESRGLFIDDVYDVAVNPTDFNHVLVSSHSGWTPNASSGLLETKDGGKTWRVHEPRPSWGSGHSIKFLYQPEQGIGNASTWLLGTQDDGYWRTTNAGANWTRVTKTNIFHGGSHIYYGRNGVLYTTAVSGILRSQDNGATFTQAADLGGTTGIIGDGKLLYTSPAYAVGPQPFFTSPELDGKTWTEFSKQALPDWGPFEMVVDHVNGILYSSNWFQGLYALKLAK